ncbi:major facilitator superfamily domain-containing protein 10 [Culicoides brevitarsis]|uniref:major facilitator superfamily domain-containing protein 10 n=1 Tax=Culicoides brevitarsis TaxID=469753 RepID=UPI00307B5ECB
MAATKEKILTNGDKKGKDSTEKTPTGVYIVFVSMLLDLLSFTLILPLFPSLLEYYEQHDKNGLYSYLSSSIRSFQEFMQIPTKFNSVLFGGCLGSMFSFLQFVASPIVGALSDVHGRKPVLLICLVGIASSYLLWAYSRNFGIFVLARFIGGLSKGNISLSMAIITDMTNQKTRGKGMALVGIAFSLGFIVGPMIGAIFSKISDKSAEQWFYYPAIFAMILAVADIIFVVFCLKESLPREKRSKQLFDSLSQATHYINIRSLFTYVQVKGLSRRDLDDLKRISFIYFVYLFIYSGLEFTITFLMYHHFNYTSIDQAKMFLTTGVIMTILQGGVVRRLSPNLSQKSAVFGLYLIIPSFIIIGFAKNSFMLYAGMVLFAISTAFVVTCLTTLISRYGSFDQKGSILGIFRSIGALARAVGPIIASLCFWSFGAKVTYVVGGIMLFYPALTLQSLNLSQKIQY